MAKAALELTLEKAPNRGIAFTFYQRQDEAAVTLLQVELLQRRTAVS
jgi:hypothetical protein